MQPSPVFEAPLVRALLRTLLFAALLETVFFRLISIPAGAGEQAWLNNLHASTNRAGMLMFFLAFLVLIPTMISIAYATLRLPAWPGYLNGLISMGLLTLSALAVSASVGPKGPAFALGFTVLGLLLSLAMLAGFYERQPTGAARGFAVALAGSLVCFSVAEGGGLAASLGLIPRSPVLEPASMAGGWWLLFAAGVLAFFTFAPGAEAGPRAGRAAAYGLSAATAFGLALGVIFQPAILQGIRPALGSGSWGLLPDIFRTGAAVAALFLVSLTAIRGLQRPALRPRALGLIFLVLAGYPRWVAYQHLLSVVGVVLITGSALPPRPAHTRMGTPQGPSPPIPVGFASPSRTDG
jgi:hypothetical protein